ncbi:hypothetical protein EMPS_00343 [Entomortierella parvispora]|uniref:AAA-ATPase-like domain-containing protein n=1 Tax=Entomortierella parvispora TaxID=205924 RepID=A0A9P3H1I7_9FUNG|nr:hypothetical protein EMPS_00343 [Entomortierella parvispora]
MSADYLIENLIFKNNATESIIQCADLVRGVLSTVKDPKGPLSMIKGIYLMADEYDSYSNDYLVPVDSVKWKPQRAEVDSVLKGFWSSVKANLGNHSITKCYITVVSPQSLAASGFNVAEYVCTSRLLPSLMIAIIDLPNRL